MNKSTLLVVIGTIAALFLMYSSEVHGADIGLDVIKNQFLPAEFRNTNFTLDDLKKVFREKCKKAVGMDNSTLYANIEKGVYILKDCLSNLANITAIQEEIEEARPIGELDTVFSKYCSKVPEARECINDFNEKIQPCLSVEERKQNNILFRIITNLMGFMCSKGGDQIALFIAEEGPECVEANKEYIGICANRSFSQYIPKDGKMPDLYNLPELILKPEHCIDLEKFRACTIHHLEQCNEITPANVAESIFKFIKNETNCLSYIEKKANERSVLRDSRSSGVAATLGFLTVIISSLVAFTFNNPVVL